jgi:SPP1 family predicted phage head-tail adaptor
MTGLGKFRHTLTLQRQVHPEDDFIDDGEQWDTVAAIRAEVMPMSGKELLEARQIVANVTHKVTTHWQPIFKSDMRLDFHGRVLNIASVINVGERSRRCEMMCVEKA